MIKIFLIFILIGIVLALILGCVQVYIDNKRGEDVSDFPTAICYVGLMNWFYVYYFVKKYLIK